MNDTTTELVTTDQFTAALPQPELSVANNKPPPDAKALRTEAVGALLGEAYKGASTLKLKADEAKILTADFADSDVEIRPHDGLIYLSHMTLRERLWSVFQPGEVAEICRERFFKNETNEVAVDLVLMVRGHFVAEAIGMAKYYPQNPKTSFGDVVESAWSDALRRCCKRWHVGTQVWRPGYVREWIANNAVQQNVPISKQFPNGIKWVRKGDQQTPAPPARKTREYTMKDDKPVSEFQKMKAAVQGVGEPEIDEATGLPF